MLKVETGKTVKINYTGKFENGDVFDTSLVEGREPLRTMLGQGNLIPGFEKGLMGMSEGENKEITIEPLEGYGEYLDGLVTTVEKKQVPDTVKVGDVLQSEGERGVMNVTVTEITDDNVTLDANHPLAGKKLVFDVEVLEIV
jgi:FKBP-type peptidyl-prolyl cis-trans isomerase 2